jgi:hypothetical protein
MNTNNDEQYSIMILQCLKYNREWYRDRQIFNDLQNIVGFVTIFQSK